MYAASPSANNRDAHHGAQGRSFNRPAPGFDPIIPSPARGNRESNSATTTNNAASPAVAGGDGGGSSNQKKSSGGGSANVFAQRYKTKLCRHFEEDSESPQGYSCKCPYKKKCMFAHSPAELRTTAENVADGILNKDAIRTFRKRSKASAALAAQIGARIDGMNSPSPAPRSPHSSHSYEGSLGSSWNSNSRSMNNNSSSFIEGMVGGGLPPPSPPNATVPRAALTSGGHRHGPDAINFGTPSAHTSSHIVLPTQAVHGVLLHGTVETGSRKSRSHSESSGNVSSGGGAAATTTSGKSFVSIECMNHQQPLTAQERAQGFYTHSPYVSGATAQSPRPTDGSALDKNVFSWIYNPLCPCDQCGRHRQHHSSSSHDSEDSQKHSSNATPRSESARPDYSPQHPTPL